MINNLLYIYVIIFPSRRSRVRPSPTAQKFISSTKIEYRRFLQSFCRKRMMDLRFFYVFLLSLFVLFLPL
ncbi:hypothetical protein BF2438 [Bacteroides fragilis YCH46]|uniref:Transmembrane protein n=1 Tax=Bacteroides fragilis (strain YCH46) TaxID=295405 RepID=Q64TJ2_BACFR|nr:hypothetical protein BF2438 [Bacteroides fragilis YCH46]